MTAEEIIRRCADCAFHAPVYGEGRDLLVECRRFPKTPLHRWHDSGRTTVNYVGYEFPKMQTTEWCGEFKPEAKK